MPGPKRIHPDIRYAQEVTVWRTAEKQGRIAIELPNPKAAIALRHRLNTCRAAYRDMSAGAWLEWDRFAVRLDGNTLLIEPKEAINLGALYAVKDDGSRIALSQTDIMLGENELEAQNPLPQWQPTPPVPGAVQPSFDPNAAGRASAEMAKIYEQTRPKGGPDVPVYRGHSGVFPKMPPPPETFDPNAPLDLDKE
jgi:hypothetical protein